MSKTLTQYAQTAFTIENPKKNKLPVTITFGSSGSALTIEPGHSFVMNMPREAFFGPIEVPSAN